MTLVRRILISLIFIVISLLCLIWLASPMITRHLLKDPLAAQGVVLAKESSVRLNPFASRLTIKDVELRRDDTQTYQLKFLRLDYSLWRLVFKEIRLQRIALQGMSMLVSLDDDSVNLAGFLIQASEQEPKASNDEETQPFQTEFSLSAPEIVLQDIAITILNQGYEHSVQIERLGILNTRFEDSKFGSTVQMLANVDGVGIESDLQLVGAIGQSDIALTLNIENINTSSIAYLLPAQIDDLSLAADVSIAMGVNISGRDISIYDANVDFSLENLNYQDQVIKATLANAALQLSSIGLEFSTEDSHLKLTADSELSLNSLDVGVLANKGQLLQLESFESGKVSLDVRDESFQILADTFTLKSITASQVEDSKLPALVQLDSLIIKDLDIMNSSVSLEAIELGGGVLTVDIDKERNMRTLVDTSSLTKETSQANASDVDVTEELVAVPEANDTFAVKLSTFELTAPMQIDISDLSNSSAYRKSFILQTVKINTIDTQAPEAKTEFLVEMKDQDYFTAVLSGWVQLFKEKINVESIATIREFPLYEVAPYLRDSLGFEVKSGELDADIIVNVTENIIDSQADLLMRGANFASSQNSPENESTSLVGQTAIPLNVALNMLKDGDGNIELKIPVDGDINDPNFGLRHIVSLVVKKVAFAQAKQHMMTMFVPYAKVVSVAMIAGEEALKVRFEDLIYLPGQIEPDDSQMEFVNQFSLLMSEDESLVVNVCPIVTSNDIQFEPTATLTADQVEQLTSLADARGKAFKSLVIAKAGIESSRLLICSAKIDKKSEAKPRIDFGT